MMVCKPRMRLRCAAFGTIAGLLLAVPMQMLFDRRAAIDLIGVDIAPQPAKAGHDIAIKWRVNSYRSCGGYVIPRIIAESGHIYEFARKATVYQSIMQENPRAFVKYLLLPESLPPGHHHYAAVVVRWCNVLQEYLWPMVEPQQPIPFEVVR